jgi:hypothetical protein
LCSDIVHIEWSDRRGIARRTIAILEEINPSSALLLLDIDRPPCCADAVRLSPCGYAGRARNCRASDSGFHIEITFDPGSRWSVEEYRPSHCFDPNTFRH